jgi:hypothetical protein
MLMKQEVWRSEIDFFYFFAESFGKALGQEFFAESLWLGSRHT